MNKFIIIAFVSIIFSACGNSAKTEKEEEKQRDSIDVAQQIKDSLDVEAKILQDMEDEDDSLKAEQKAESTPKVSK